VHERAGGRLNLLLVDGRRAYATAIGNTLFVRRARGASVVASEPLDDGVGWEPVADRSFVEATPDRTVSSPL
jgi:glutamine amidotransferase